MKLRIMLALTVCSSVGASNAFAGFGDNGGGNFLSTTLMFLVIMFVVFLILREFMCWYWKMNRTVELLETISNTNTKVLEQLQQLTKSAANTPEQQKILAEAKKLEEQGEEAALEARKLRASTLKSRNVCPNCYRDYSPYVINCEVCETGLITA